MHDSDDTPSACLVAVICLLGGVVWSFAIYGFCRLIQ